MSTIKRAISIAGKAHKYQTDKAGVAYIFHCVCVMAQMDTEEEMIVAVLHDLIEDTEWTLMELREEGFLEEIVMAIECLTRESKETYDDYIQRIKTNKMATKVKIADLTDNMNERRLKKVTETDKKRLAKYACALVELM